MGKYDRDFPRWARMASDYDTHSIGLGNFALAASKLTPTRNELRKTVIAAGIGSTFPERALVCTVGSKFLKVKPDIHELICADPEIFINPTFYLSTPVQTRFLDHQQPKPSIKLRTEGVSFYPASLQELLPELDLSTISISALIFFSIPDIEEQLRAGLGKLIEGVLRPGGVFMGSGSFVNKRVELHNDMTVERSVRFSDIDHAGTYLNHFGFLATKPRKP